MFYVDYDPVYKHIYAKSVGFHTVDEIRQLGARIRIAAQEAVRDSGRAFLLMNSLDATVMSQEAMAEMDKTRSTTHEAVDRAAAVVASTLMKIQTERAAEANSTRVFLSMLEALNWLHGDEQGRDWSEVANKYTADRRS